VTDASELPVLEKPFDLDEYRSFLERLVEADPRR